MSATSRAGASREVGSRIAVVVRYVAYVALPVHVVLLAVFALTGVREMALFNIWSVAMWIAVWVSNARGRQRLASLLLNVEVTAHGVAAVALLGLGSGFQYYLVPIIALTLFNDQVRPRTAIVGSGSIVALFVAVHYAFADTVMHPGWAPLSAPFEAVNIVTALVFVCVICAYFRFASIDIETKMEDLASSLERRVEEQVAEIVARADEMRVVEAQKATIARERAQSEALLKQELSHQVAERSRELGAVLAKTDTVLDVRRLLPGELFADRYRIVAGIGAGGMGAVFHVERTTDREHLALKAVVGEISGPSAARFAREAEIGARVRHVNLVSIVDVGVSAGVPFLVMELVRGGSLENQRARFGNTPWALPILRQIAEGVAALHDAGVVHRDLKPANVLLTVGADDRVTTKRGLVAKISDFGISRFGTLEDAASSIDPNAATVGPSSPSARPHALTGTGMLMGTPLYMAPEAARGGRNLDARADVFALGIIAYEMLIGRAPFDVPPVLLAMAGQATPVVTPIDDPRVPALLRAALLDCLAADPTKRPRARTLLAALPS